MSCRGAGGGYDRTECAGWGRRIAKLRSVRKVQADGSQHYNRAQETVCADKKERRSKIKSVVPPPAQQSTRPYRRMPLLRRTLLSDRSRHHSRNDIILLAFARCCVLRSVLQS